MSKRLQIKLDGEWRDIEYVREGYTYLNKDQNGTYASLMLKNDEPNTSEGCTFGAIEDVRLIDNTDDFYGKSEACEELAKDLKDQQRRIETIMNGGKFEKFPIGYGLDISTSHMCDDEIENWRVLNRELEAIKKALNKLLSLA